MAPFYVSAILAGAETIVQIPRIAELETTRARVGGGDVPPTGSRGDPVTNCRNCLCSSTS